MNPNAGTIVQQEYHEKSLETEKEKPPSNNTNFMNYGKCFK